MSRVYGSDIAVSQQCYNRSKWEAITGPRREGCKRAEIWPPHKRGFCFFLVFFFVLAGRGGDWDFLSNLKKRIGTIHVQAL